MKITPRRQASSVTAIAAATSARVAAPPGAMSAPTARKIRPKLSSTSARPRSPRQQRPLVVDLGPDRLQPVGRAAPLARAQDLEDAPLDRRDPVRRRVPRPGLLEARQGDMELRQHRNAERLAPRRRQPAPGPRRLDRRRPGEYLRQVDRDCGTE